MGMPPTLRFPSRRQTETPEPNAVDITIGSTGTNIKPDVGKYYPEKILNLNLP
jgi:hypothetical protein